MNAMKWAGHALAYNRDNSLRTLAIPEAIAEWSLTRLMTVQRTLACCVTRGGLHLAPNRQLGWPSAWKIDGVARHGLEKDGHMGIPAKCNT
jgi:hypothetical protein